jgi:hypothetical protein
VGHGFDAAAEFPVGAAYHESHPNHAETPVSLCLATLAGRPAAGRKPRPTPGLEKSKWYWARVPAPLSFFEQVPHLLAFGFQISPPGFMRRRDAGHAFRHHDSRVFESFDFIGIVRHQAHARNPQMPQNRPGQRVTPQVALEPELFVCFHRIGAVILQLISAQLVHQADTAAFLVFVDDQASPLSRNRMQRDLELRPAIAPQTMKDVSGQALRMDAQKRGRPVVNVTRPSNP